MWRIAVLAVALIHASPLAAQTGGEWKPMFHGKSLDGWKPTAFKGDGPVKLADGAMVLGPGAPLSGVNYTPDFPKLDYEIRFEAARLRGNDFFASLTFPVGDSFATFVTGGWGGDIVGMSSIDGWDASENETRSYVEFENGRYYAFRLRVTASRVSAWIDDRQVFDVAIQGRTIDLRRGEIKLSTPLGFAAYNTVGSIRMVEYRTISAERR